MVNDAPRPSLSVFAALLIMAAVGMAFGWLHIWWFSYAPGAARIALLFLAGQLMGVFLGPLYRMIAPPA